MDDLKFQQLLEYLDLSFSGYRKVRKGVKKRVNRHMQELGCRNVAEYLSILNNREDLVKDVRLLMTVSISRFFRDQHMWQVIEQEILPLLIHNKSINIWSAGCACGEEVYSINIIKDRLKHVFPDFPEFRITATDMNPVYIQKAHIGVYPASSLREVPETWQNQYFNKKGRKKQFAVQEHLKENILWDVRSLESSPPISHFNIIFLRNNLLTYYTPHVQKNIFNTILDSLAPLGWLIIGSRETLPDECPDLKNLRSCAFIYRKCS